MSTTSTEPGTAEALLSLDEARGRWVLFAAVLGSGIAMIDGTVVNIALPTLGRALHADFGALQWTVNGYTLTLASFILLGGSFGDRFGRRKVFVVGVTWFGVASLICGARAEHQRAHRRPHAPGHRRRAAHARQPGASSRRRSARPTAARAIGAWSGLGGIASAIGPLLGGVPRARSRGGSSS